MLQQINYIDLKYRNLLTNIIFLAVLLLIFGLAYRNLIPWQMLASCDLTAWFHNTTDALTNFNHPWSDIFLGRVMPITPGEFLLESSLISISGGNAGIAQGIFYLSLLPISAIGMYYLLGTFIGSNPYRIIVSILYGVNGLTVVWFMGGGQALLPWHAFFPLLMLYLIKILEKDDGRIKNILIFSLLLALIASFQIHMYMLWLFLPFILVFFLLEIANRRDYKYTLRTILLFTTSAIILTFLLLPILIGHILDIFGYYINTEEASLFTGGYTVDYLVQSVLDNYNNENTKTMFLNFGYVIFPMIFLTFLVRDRVKKKYYLGFLLISSLTLLFALLLSTNWIAGILRIFPGIFVVRSPARLAFVLSWCLFPMLGILTSEVYQRINFNKISQWKTPFFRATKNISLSGILIGISFFGVTGDYKPPESSGYLDNMAMFINGENDFGSIDLGEIPPYFQDIHDWLDNRHQEEGFFRTLWLPCDRITVNKVLLRYDPLTFVGISDEVNYFTLTLMPLLNRSTDEIGKLLLPYNVKYVVVPLEGWTGKYLENWYQGEPRIAYQPPFGYYAVGDPLKYIPLLEKQKDLRIVTSNRNYAIYENTEFTGDKHVSAYNKLLLVAPFSVINESTKSSSGNNLVHNPGFEDGIKSWISVDTNGSVYSNDDKTKYYGNASLKMDMNDLGSYASVYQYVLIDGGENYEFSLTAKANNTTTSNVRIYFRDENNENIYLGEDTYLKLSIPLQEEWSTIDTVIESPDNAVVMQISLDMGMGWSFMDQEKPATVWFDEIRVCKSAVQHPLQNLNYLYGYQNGLEEFPQNHLDGWSVTPANFPYEYLRGQMFVQVPKLLSKAPHIIDGNELIVYGDYIPSAQYLNDYLGASNAVVFFGDVDQNNILGEVYSQPDTLLFVYEAESELIPIPIEIEKKGSPTTLQDDDQQTFWTGAVTRQGNIGTPEFLDTETEKVSGNSSLQITVGEGEGASWYIYHTYDEPQNWLGNDELNLGFDTFNFYWYGLNTGGSINLTAMTSPYDYFQTTFTDNFSGWKHMEVPLEYFLTAGNPCWCEIIHIELQMVHENIAGQWYMDRMYLDITPEKPKQEWSYIKDTTMSYDRGITFVGRWNAEKDFYVPRDSYYSTLLRIQGDCNNTTLLIDEKPVAYCNSYADDTSFAWLETSDIFLETGMHTLSFSIEGDVTIIDQFLLLSTIRSGTSFQDIFSFDAPEFTYNRSNPAQYDLSVASEEPSLVVLKDTYHPGWQALTSDGVSLQRTAALQLGWANGFLLDKTGLTKLKLEFDRAKPRQFAISVWGISLAIILTAILILTIRDRIKSRNRSPSL